MKILVATNHLCSSGGTESYTYYIIKNLKELNFEVFYFCFKKGRISERIENELNVREFKGGKVDLILANHINIVKKLWKYGFVIQTCHGIYPSLEQPSVFADYHVSISEEVQLYLKNKGFKSSLILNGIDCKIFNCYKPINKTLSKVLSLCHSEEAHDTVKKVCQELEIQFLKLDKIQDDKDDIYKIINEVDLVVGLGRSAYDAMACGRPVVIFDSRHYMPSFGDGYLPKYYDESVKNNCSGRYFKKNFSIDELKNEFNLFKSSDSTVVRNIALTHHNILVSINQYLNVYKTYSYNNKPFKFYLRNIRNFFFLFVFYLRKIRKKLFKN